MPAWPSDNLTLKNRVRKDTRGELLEGQRRLENALS
jgi:hypothetical protein